MSTSREVAKSTRTLICLLQSLIDSKVLIELRNDHFVLGILQSVNCYMNLELSDAYIWSLDEWIREKLNQNDYVPDEIIIHTDELPDIDWLQKQTKLDHIMIKGCRIRYFYLQKETDVIGCIEKQLEGYRRRRNFCGIQRPFNWKSYRKQLKLLKTQEKNDT